MTGPVRVPEDHERRYRGASKPATECVLNIFRTEDLVEAELGRLFRTFGLTAPMFNVLMILEGSPEPLCPAEIGARLLVTRGTVTGLLDSLEKRGLIRRTPHPDDRRMLLIQLTRAARPLLEEVWAVHFPAETALMAGLSAREQEQLIRLLGKLQDHLLRAPATAPAT